MDKELREPDFLVIGTMKSGTSSLWHQLLQHKHISGPLKEIHFFDVDDNFCRGEKYYLELLNRNIDAETLLLGEKTPTYCYKKLYANRIAEMYPGIKLVWIFREPVSRAYSHFHHAVRKGSEYYSFEKAIDMEHKRLSVKDHLCYLDRSTYDKHVENYMKYFSRQQMYFMKFEDLLAHPIEEMERLFSFLGVGSSVYKYVPEIKNAARGYTNQKWRYIARKLLGKNSIAFDIINRRVLNISNVPKPKIDTDVKVRLKNYFKPHNEALERLTGLDLSNWK